MPKLHFWDLGDHVDKQSWSSGCPEKSRMVCPISLGETPKPLCFQSHPLPLIQQKTGYCIQREQIHQELRETHTEYLIAPRMREGLVLLFFPGETTWQVKSALKVALRQIKLHLWAGSNLFSVE